MNNQQISTTVNFNQN